MDMGRDLGRGVVAGAVGTMALNALTYLDMAVRGRPASAVPAQAVQAAADAAGVRLTSDGDNETRTNRQEGLGALLGLATGVGFGAVYGIAVGRRGGVSLTAGAVALTLGAMAGANIPATAAGVTDPRKWGIQGWLADLVPHIAYGFVTAAVYEAIN